MTACKRCHGDGFAECRCVTEVPERKPSAGWVEGDGGWWRLGDDATVLSAIVRRRTDGKFSWGACSPGVMFLSGRSGTAKTADTAQLAAEDALLAIAAEIVGAVGRSAAVNARRLVEEYGNACAAAPAAISACVDGGCDAVDSMTSTIDRGNAARDELLRALGVETP